MYNTSEGRPRIVPDTFTFNSPIICFSFVTVITFMLACGCSKSPGFKAETYRAINDAVVLKLFSSAEAELTQEGDHFVCQYIREGTRLRITMDILGTKRAFYYDIIPDGLRDENGVILYKPDRFEVVMRDAKAKTTDLNLVTPNITGGNVREAKVKATKANLKVLHGAVIQFKLDTGRYPTEKAGMQELIKQPTDVTGWNAGGYLQTTSLPKDAWGNEFIYHLNSKSGQPFEVMSYGADGQEGGEGVNADLRSTD